MDSLSPFTTPSLDVDANNTDMVRHLPPTVKQLLTLRTPQPRSPPPYSKLHSVLVSTLQDAKLKKAERGWLTLAVSAVSSWLMPTRSNSYLYLREDLHAPHCECASYYRTSVSSRNTKRSRECFKPATAT